MTRTEQAELEDLKLTPEQLAAKTAEIDARVRQAKAGGTSAPAKQVGQQEAPQTCTRKPRSDKGVPKGPKAPAHTREIVVQIDLSNPDGKDLYASYFRYLVSTGKLEQAEAESEWMLKQIDRLRAK